jgi:lipoprotein signal peptidase
MFRKANIVLIAVLLVGISDAIFKHLALRFLPDEQAVTLHSPLTLAIHRNPGIAFDIPLPLTIVLPITGILVIGLSYLATAQWYVHRAQSVSALTAIVGALGNACDRLINGFTTDYLILFKTSAINLSDVLILMGILGILWYDKHLPKSEARS